MCGYENTYVIIIKSVECMCIYIYVYIYIYTSINITSSSWLERFYAKTPPGGWHHKITPEFLPALLSINSVSENRLEDAGSKCCEGA